VLASIGGILAVVAFVIGYFAIGTRTFVIHFVLGTVVLVLMTVLVIGGVWRTTLYASGPAEKEESQTKSWPEKNRHLISSGHRWLGRLVWALAVTNCFFGLDAFAYPIGFWILTVVLTAFGLVFFLAGKLYSWISNRN